MAQLENLLVHKISEEKESQANVTKKLKSGIENRDSMWKKVVNRLVAQKTALNQQVTLLKTKVEEASTTAAVERKRAVLLSQSRETKSHTAESKEVQGLMQQIQALQSENS